MAAPGCAPRTGCAANAAHRSKLLARARRIVGDPALAEEAVQEALARWRSRRPPVTRHAEATETVDHTTGIRPEDLLLLRAELADALADLGPTHRSVVVETVLRDRSHAEVAAELGIPSGTVRSRVHYALRHLRISLEATNAYA